MDSSKSRRKSSRRSSILKPPKPRQALQELNFSSNENTSTITTKIKRRVSFAEKKHVKEFCNSLDQGTLWNNTYEEHDISNLKVLGISIEEESEIQSGSIQQNAIQFFCNKEIEKEINIKDCKSHTTNIVEDVNYQDKMQLTTVSLAFHDENNKVNAVTYLSDLQFENDNHTSKGITIYQDTDEKLLKANTHNFICKKLDVTTLEETSMDFTQIVSNIICSETNCIQNNTVEDIVNNESMELTETILPSMNVQSFQQIAKSTEAVPDTVDENMSMEFTAACVMKPVDNVSNAETLMTVESDEARTKKLDNISMEMTAAVCRIQTNDNGRNHCTPNTNDIFISKDNTTTTTSSSVHSVIIPGKENSNTYHSSEYFNNSTKAVPDTVDENMSMELTAACVMKPVDNVSNAETLMTLESDEARTKELDNISMEMTAAVCRIQTNDNGRNHCTPNTNDIFISKDNTTTTTSSSVHSVTIPGKENSNTYHSSEYFNNSTKAVTDTVDENMSMEFTAACVMKPVDNVSNAETLMTVESDEARTKKLDNISMEMTAAVCRIQTNDNGRNHCTPNTNDIFISKDNTTTTTSSSVHSVTIPGKENSNTYHSSEYFNNSTKAVTDTVDENMSMEFTAACVMKPVDNVSNAETLMTVESDEARTKKLDNISMEMTAAVCRIQTNDNGRNHCTPNTNDIFTSKDNTTTTTSSSVHSVTIPGKENSNTYHSSEYFNNSTKAVPDTVDENMSMEFTAACVMKPVDNVSNAETLMTLESDEARTKKLDNISMEMTAAVCRIQTNDNGRNHCTPNTNDIFISKDNTTTTTSSSVHSVTIPGKENSNTYHSSEYFNNSTKAVTDTVDENMSMEFTAACVMKPVDNVSNAETLMTVESDEARTKKLDNISMEMTAAVCRIQTNDNGRNHCTPNTNDIFISKDNTTTTTSSSVHSVTIPGKENSNTYHSSEYFNNSTKAVPDTVDENMSMEFTAACVLKPVDNVSNAETLMTLESDEARTKKLDNISMEMTAAVCRIQTNDNGRNHCTPNTNDIFISKDNTTTTSSSVHSVTIPGKENSNTYHSSEYFNNSTKAVTYTVDENMSMEFTAACVMKPVDNVSNAETLMTVESDEARTKKLDNISMEMTAAVCRIQTNDNGRNHCTPNTNDIFISKDNTTTTTSSSVHSVTIPGKENSNTYHSSEYFNNSTKAVPDTVDENMSMEFTAACVMKPVDNVNNAETLMTVESDEANTTTTTSSSVHSVTIPGKENSNTYHSSEYFNNSTKAVPDTVDENMSMEFTAACVMKPVDNVNNAETLMTVESDEARTKKLDNISMEMSAAVCHMETNYNGRNHCTPNTNDIFISKDNTTTTSSSVHSVTKSNSRSSLQNVNNLQTQEDHDIFFNYGLEELDSIKPPSFIDLDDLSIMETSVNVNYDQKINTTSCLLKNENNGRKHTLELEDQQVNIPEKMRKLQTSVIKYTSANGTLISSILEQEDQVQTDKIQELSDVRNANVGIQVLECSVVNDNGMSSMMSGSEKEFQNLHIENFSSKENVMKCSSANIIPQIKIIDKLTDTQVVEVDGEHLKSHVSCEEQSIVNKLKICAKSDDIIWEVYCEDIKRNIFAIGFISCSLLVVIFLQDSCDLTDNEYIKTIKIVSRLADDADALISIVHRIILEKLDTNKLVNLYKKCEDILPMLDYISKEVKLAMDFMFDVKRLYDINLMEITRDSVSFVSRSKKCDIILQVVVNIKPFDKIKSQDISVHCLLGSIRTEVVKMLITNIKRDHKFLRRYINDVREYICLMEETGNVI